MAVPKKKTSKSKRDMRRAHDGLKLVQTVECANCGARHLPHHVCDKCGWYNKKSIVAIRSTADESGDEE